MKYAILFHFGAADRPSIFREGEYERIFPIDLFAAQNALSFNIPPLLKGLFDRNLTPTEDALDLLLLGAAVFGADTHISRDHASQNAWTREIAISLPVSNLTKWEAAGPILEKLLLFLSGDYWTLKFRKRPKGVPALIKKAKNGKGSNYSCVSLFSGGLDSFIGAIDLLEEKGNPIFVSHSWVRGASHHQRMCFESLKTKYLAQVILHLPGRIAFPKDVMSGMLREDSERSRSFLFFSMAVLAASSIAGETPIFVPENGLISLNVPIDHLRLGSLSTRTTHPFVITRFNEVLTALGIAAHLVNPYAHTTKGEMVLGCKSAAFLKSKIKDTMSCSSPGKGRWTGLPHGHCGHCVPCIIRRASLQDITGGDPTPYAPVSDLRARRLNSKRPEGEHIRSFQLAIDRLNGDISRAKVIIRKPGSLKDSEAETDALAGVYLRGMAEIEQLLDGVVTAPL